MFRSLAFKMVYTALMFLSSLLLSKLLLPEFFGVVSLLILNASLLSLVTGLGTDTMIMHMLGNKKWSVNQAVNFMWKALALQFLIFVLIESCCYLVFDVTLLTNETGWQYLLLDITYFTGLILVEKFTALLYSMHRAVAINLQLTIVATLFFLVLAILYIADDVTVNTLLYLFCFQNLLQGLVLLGFFTAKHATAGKNMEKVKLGAYLKLSSIVVITNIIQLLAYRVDYWLIKFFYSNYEVGLYAQANKFANLVWLIPNIATQLLIPQFLQLEKEGGLKKVFSVSILVNFVMVLSTVILANMVFYLFLYPDYMEALPAFYLMLPGYFFWAAVIYFAGYFSWQGKFSFNLYGSMGCLVIIFLADLVLIPILSVNGAAIANSIAYSAVFIFYLLLMKKHNALQWRDLFQFSRKNIQQIFQLLK